MFKKVIELRVFFFLFWVVAWNMNIVEGTGHFVAWIAGASRFSATRKKLFRKRSVLWLP